MTDDRKSPCLSCKSVNAEACENKNCEKWRKWFLAWWNEIREKYYKEGGGDA